MTELSPNVDAAARRCSCVEWIESESFGVADLFEATPPRFEVENKRALYALVAGRRFAPDRELEVARVRAVDDLALRRLPVAPTCVRIEPGVYDYLRHPAEARHWWVNFADPELFGYYAGELLAQDELQVLEHPVLGALVECLRRSGLVRPRTTVGTTPTPVLVEGAPRQLWLDLRPRPESGLPHGPYGNAFRRVPVEVVLACTRVLDDAPPSDLICMAAPRSGRGVYGEEDLRYAITCAFAGFAAAVARSSSVADPDPRFPAHAGHAPCVVHSGFWGCGAFGGSRTLMIAVQTIAARCAGVETLVLHTIDAEGAREAEEGVALAHRLVDEVAAEVPPELRLADVIEDLLALGFTWGRPNGT